MSLEKLWFYPPLAFARLGGSDTPLECFFWGEDDNSPRGTGKTTILPDVTLKVEDDGSLTSYQPSQVRFKDGDLFRPVCPFFELHAAWRDEYGVLHEEPVSERLLAVHGIALGDLLWTIEVANLKPYNLTQDPDTRIGVSLSIAGDDWQPQELHGVAPKDARNPLVPHGSSIPLGFARLIKPNAAYPALRIRFTPGRGHFYGPTNLLSRWQGLKLDPRFLFLNPDSSYCRWSPSTEDSRATPGGQFAQDDSGVSYGMIDDVCDGLITCRINPKQGSAALPDLVAHARVSVAPPDYAPDRRHLVSLADGLKDRVDRADVVDERYFDDEALCDAELRELMQRIYETAALSNVDVFNDRVNNQENLEIAVRQGVPFKAQQFIAFKPRQAIEGRPLPLADAARDHHRRFQVLEVLVDLIRKNPDFISMHVREPMDLQAFFTSRMPAVMQGPSGDPLTLTHRQYEFLLRWARKKSEPATPGANL